MTTHNQPTNPYAASEPFTDNDAFRVTLDACPLCAGPLAVRVIYPADPVNPQEVLLAVRCADNSLCNTPSLTGISHHSQVIRYINTGLGLPK